MSATMETAAAAVIAEFLVRREGMEQARCTALERARAGGRLAAAWQAVVAALHGNLPVAATTCVPLEPASVFRVVEAEMFSGR